MAFADPQPVIIKKVKKSAHAHHGGAWKIAYADFVTAMMAFFLMLWLISMTTPLQKKGIADYFAPPNVSQTTSGAGGVFGGTSLDEVKAAKLSGAPTEARSCTAPRSEKAGPMLSVKGGEEAKPTEDSDPNKSAQKSIEAKYDMQFNSAAESIKQAFRALPEVTKASDNIKVEQTKDALDIIISDTQGQRMFPEGSKYPVEVVRQALAAMAPILQKLGATVSITGYVAAGTKFDNPRYGPWELSSDRGNTTRQILEEFGLSGGCVGSVTGRASTNPIFPDDPYLSANERVEITIPRSSPPVPPNLAL